jgi:Zn-dependent protease with chaperone function
VSELVETRLRGISSKAYEHPTDRAATAALQSIPGLDAVIRKLIEMRYERAFRQSLMASAVRVGPDQVPALWSAWERASTTLDLAGSHDLYITHFPVANAAAVGSGNPIVVVNSAAISLFDEQELQTVLAHEAGHILSDHVLYRTALLIMLQLAPLGRIPTLSGLPVLAIRSALLEWFRAAELSADRAATLVNRDPLVTSRTLLVLASGLPSTQLNVNAFLRQAQDYHEWDSTWDRVSRTITELNLTHSHPVRRVYELMAWVRAGDYDRIVGGSYRKRDEPADAAAEAGEAFRHYTKRFQRIFEDTGESLGKVPEVMADWLRQIRR